ncbi:MAG: phosphoenolpyruvate--protein phosphotransferase [Acidobacteria bacterium]|jgi:fructose-specific PTS system IIA-like component|nr:phosphoenolpyruvate--protein phosphotransferase [Acidobacteriota bacterium]
MARQFIFKFPLAHGLHARPASLIQEVARRFNASISWENTRSHKYADSKSVLSLIAGEIWKDDPCRIIIDGDDELEAEKTLYTFLINELPKYEEETPGPLHPSKEISIPRAIKKENSLYFTGTGAGSGISLAPAFIFDGLPPGVLPSGILPGSNKPKAKAIETRDVQDAINQLRLELTRSIDQSRNLIEKNILEAHLAIVQDKTYLETIINYINKHNFSAVKAVYETAQYFTGILQNSKSYYIRQRLFDIKDISTRVVASLNRVCGASPAAVTGSDIQLKVPIILIAENILPSQFMSLDKQYLKGLILSEGGTTSHTIILARAFNIPTITGIQDIQKRITPGETVIIDAGRGLVIPSPSPSLSFFYEREMEKQQHIKEKAALFIPGPGTTADGKNLVIAANIGSIEELESAFLNGAEGIGLFRTEWLFMDKKTPPSEEEQFDIYSRAAAAAGKRPVIIRTLDIGGDKPLPYLDLAKEPNPFLGYRAIRVYNELGDLIKTQLRAIIRAAINGNLKIMFPMINCLEEIRDLKKQLQAIMKELTQEGLPFNPWISFGIMVETPAAVFALPEISEEVDFFSIGSNDLTQYFLAADRSNPKVSYIYNAFYPSFLRLLNKISAEAHSHGKWLGLCGELAGNIDYLPIWVGLGFDEISLASSTIPAVKAALKKLKTAACRKLVNQLLKTPTAQQFREMLADFSHSQSQEALLTEELINLESVSLSKEEAVRELVNLLELAGRIENSDEVEELIFKREESYSTGIGFGIAIPHCQAPQVKHNSIVFLKLKKAIDWQSLDDQPVDIILLLVIRSSHDDKEHLRILARLSRKLMDEEFAAKLRLITKPSCIIDLIKNV